MKLFKISNIALLIVLSSSMLFNSCTDLEEQIIDEIISEDINTVAGAELSLLASTYDKGEGIFANYGGTWCLQQMTTDEALLPARGEDWYDGGKWKTLHEFNWNENSPKVRDNWNNLNKAVAQAASTIDVLKNSSIPQKEQYLAEAKGLWVLYTYNIVDLFGQIPYRDPMNLSYSDVPEILNSVDALNICVTMLEEIIPSLAEFGQQSTHAGRFTKEAAYALLAKIYLNMAVYEDRYNESASFDFVSSGYMDEVIKYCDMLISSSKFELEDDYFEIFGVDNNNSSENIFAVIQKATGSNRGQNDFTYLSMGRNQKANPDNNRGSNATCTTPDYFATWDNNRTDPRFHKHTVKNGGVAFRNDGTDVSLPYNGVFHFNRGFQEGQQYGPIITDGAFEMDPNNSSNVLVQTLYTEKTPDLLLDFTRELNFDNSASAAFSQNQINRGIRVFKQEYDAENTRKYGGVDIAVFRLGMIYTMRAEAKFRKGDISGALADINKLRTSRWSIDIDGNQYYGEEINALTEEVLYNEMSYETYWEGERRQQMIRFGTYEDAYTAKAVSSPYLRIFPIPQSELDVNKGFDQNTGY
ncbi:RagB/SusD family nutrient uptake outer membrane protein [Marinifilum sp.]|uniref:RagB/SusD family nutrient uptake outer membrane protein n=1 Tax=Marinifilum sp. TaxID=2033137 RepID=UPI003BAB98D3